MAQLIVVLLLSWLSLSSCALPQKLPRWLDEEVETADLSPEEEERRLQFSEIWAFLDDDSDGQLSIEEIHEKKSMLSTLEEEDEGEHISYPQLKLLFTGGDFPLMHLNVFDDMWWIITHELKEELKDYTDLFFEHADVNADERVDKGEFKLLVVTGGRTKHTPDPKTPLRQLLKVLDADSSGGLNHHEIWGPISTLIKSTDRKALTVAEFGAVAQKHSSLPSDVVDFNKVATCLDKDADGFITLDDEVNFVEVLDKNYSGEVEEHEFKELPQEVDICIERLKAKSGNSDTTEERATVKVDESPGDSRDEL